MGALDPIAGVSLEKYTDLCAQMKDCGTDVAACVAIAEKHGVDAASWKAAQDGWTARMHDPATAGQVALAFMPLYQAALARVGPIATASFEDYVGMSSMLNCKLYGLEKMYAHYGLDSPKWSQISTYWVDKLTKDPQLGGKFAGLCKEEIARLEAGGAPPARGQGATPDAPTAADIGKAAGDISDLPPVAVGQNCYVQWNDGNRYVGTVKQAGKGQCLVAFPGGREDWIPNQYISGK